MADQNNAQMTDKQLEKAKRKEKNKILRSRMRNKNVPFKANEMVHVYYTEIPDVEMIFYTMDVDLLGLQGVGATLYKQKQAIAFKDGKNVIAVLIANGTGKNGKHKFQLQSEVHKNIDDTFVRAQFRCALIAVERALVSMDLDAGVIRTFNDVRLSVSFF